MSPHPLGGHNPPLCIYIHQGLSPQVAELRVRNFGPRDVALPCGHRARAGVGLAVLLTEYIACSCAERPRAWVSAVPDAASLRCPPRRLWARGFRMPSLPVSTNPSTGATSLARNSYGSGMPRWLGVEWCAADIHPPVLYQRRHRVGHDVPLNELASARVGRPAWSIGGPKLASCPGPRRANTPCFSRCSKWPGAPETERPHVAGQK